MVKVALQQIFTAVELPLPGGVQERAADLQWEQLNGSEV